jgi:hypothetical protein
MASNFPSFRRDEEIMREFAFLRTIEGGQWHKIRMMVWVILWNNTEIVHPSGGKKIKNRFGHQKGRSPFQANIWAPGRPSPFGFFFF